MQGDARYRYPGINFFTKVDKDIFCGRGDDINKLFTRILLNHTVVLHGESGTGKSSLVQAGLLPELENYNKILEEQGKPPYVSVTIRFDSLNQQQANDSWILVRKTLNSIAENKMFQADSLPFIGPQENSLWYAAKLLERKNNTLLLIFDQFEEVQRFPDAIGNFVEKLSELFVATMPEGIYNEYDSNTAYYEQRSDLTKENLEVFNDDIKFLEQPLRVRILFVVREDKLGTMSLLSDHFPDILKSDFFLQPLNEKSAREAIIGPASKEGNFITPKFQYSEEAVQQILDGIVDPVTKLYDPIQLQIVSSRVEKQFGGKKELISKSDVPSIGNFISDFYKDTWVAVKKEFKMSDDEFEKERKNIIEKLVVDGRRNLVLENILAGEGNKRGKDIMGLLVREGLIRRLISGKDFFYQLCHDRLMEPLNQDLLNFKAKENVQEQLDKEKLQLSKRRKRVLTGFAILMSLATILLFYFYSQARKAERTADEEKHLLISTALKRAGNNTLSYLVLRDWKEKHKGAVRASERLKQIDSVSQFYLTGVYTSFSPVLDVAPTGKNELTFYEESQQTVWNTNKKMLVSRQPQSRGKLIKKFQGRNQKQYRVYGTKDSVIIYDEQGRKITSGSGFYNSSMYIAISPDEQHLIIYDQLFGTKPYRLLGSFPTLKKESNPNSKQSRVFNSDLYYTTQIAFLTDTSVAVAYENGYVIKYGINENRPKTILAIDTILKNDYWLEGSYIAWMLSCGNRLFIGNSKNSVYFNFGKDYVGKLDYAIPMQVPGGLLKGIVISPDTNLILHITESNMAYLCDESLFGAVTTLQFPEEVILQNAFFLDTLTIAFVTENNNIYIWQKQKPSLLYHKLYRFTPYHYLYNELEEKKDGIPGDTNSTASLYSVTLNYITNLSVRSSYEEDSIYWTSFDRARREINVLYNNLTVRKDYSVIISSPARALLDKNYYALLSRTIIRSEWKKEDTIIVWQYYAWRSLLADTSSVPYYGFRDLINIPKFIGQRLDSRGKEFEKGYNYLKIYNDSLLQPLLTQFQQYPQVQEFKRTLDVFWVKYYLYTGKNKEAEDVVRQMPEIALAMESSEMYLIPVLLVTDRYAEAIALYKKLYQTIPPKIKSQSFRNLRRFMTTLSRKQISMKDTIDKFLMETEL